MPNKKVEKEDSQEVTKQASARLSDREGKRKALVNRYMAEDKVPVTISPFYAPHFGKVVPVLVNGIRVDIPADGRTYKINKTHADEVISKLRRVDNFMARQKRAADVSKNLEHNVGELQI